MRLMRKVCLVCVLWRILNINIHDANGHQKLPLLKTMGYNCHCILKTLGKLVNFSK